MGLTALVLFGFAHSGCASRYTYPADTVPKAIQDLSLKEYNIAVKAQAAGKTLGAVMYFDSALESDGQIPKETFEKMSKVLFVVTRVALSTDLPVDFCSVVLRDRVHHNEFTMTRSLDDAKRANAEAIGFEESFNRIVFGQDKYEKVAGGRPVFSLKEVKLEHFLTDQIVQRIRTNFSKEPKDTKESKEPKEEAMRTPVMADGIFETAAGKRVFRFSVIALKSGDPHETILAIFKTVNQVLQGYKFAAFDAVEIQDYLNRQKLAVDRQTLLLYQQKKIKDEEILSRFLVESQSIQEAFKLFGFNLPANATDKDTPVTKPAP